MTRTSTSGYTGATEQARISQAQSGHRQDRPADGEAQEPMQMYLDTNPDEMTVWPIYPFPFADVDPERGRGAVRR